MPVIPVFWQFFQFSGIIQQEKRAFQVGINDSIPENWMVFHFSGTHEGDAEPTARKAGGKAMRKAGKPDFSTAPWGNACYFFFLGGFG